MKRKKGIRKQRDKETRKQGNKEMASPVPLSTGLLVSSKLYERIEIDYDRIPATNRRFRL